MRFVVVCAHIRGTALQGCSREFNQAAFTPVGGLVFLGTFGYEEERESCSRREAARDSGSGEPASSLGECGDLRALMKLLFLVRAGVLIRVGTGAAGGRVTGSSPLGLGISTKVQDDMALLLFLIGHHAHGDLQVLGAAGTASAVVEHSVAGLVTGNLWVERGPEFIGAGAGLAFDGRANTRQIRASEVSVADYL